MPAQQDQAEEKTEEPSERKREKAREQGQVAQSSEVKNVAVLAAGLLGLWLLGGRMGRLLVGRFTRHLGGLSRLDISAEGVVAAFRGIAEELCGVLLPFSAGIVLTALVFNVVQTKFNVSWQKLQPSPDQVNPVQGVTRLFSWSSLVRMLVAVGKLLVVSAVTAGVMYGALPQFTGVIGRGPEGVIGVCSDLTFDMLLWVCMAMTGVALADYAYQRYSHRKQLMMTKTEKKEERKQEEGQPEIEDKQEERRREMSEQRMMQDVPQADVVVTNPTHVAVALRWDEGDMEAPEVLAKGRGEVAHRIMSLARRHAVPSVRRVGLARTLYQAVDVGEEIPERLYHAVAEVLAFIARQENSAGF